MLKIRELDERYRVAVNRYIEEEWGGPLIVTRGNLYDSAALPGLVAVAEDGTPLGALLWRDEGEEREIAVLFALAKGVGVGSALLDAAAGAARAAGRRRLWLVTTNDNTRAIRFYQMRGLRLAAVRLGAMNEARRLKPGIPPLGEDGIAIEHEVEFEVPLASPGRAQGIVEYRPAKPADAAGLHALNDLFNGAGCNSLEAVTKSIEGNEQEIICVAANGDGLIGFCCGQIFKSMCYGVHYGEITELFVLEDYRRGGVGSGLMASMEAEFQKRGINHFQLFTGQSNRGAQAFYENLGYARSDELMFRKRPREEKTGIE